MNSLSDESADEKLAELLVDAGPRPQPSSDATARAYEILKSEWLTQVTARQTRTRQTRLISLSAVAAVSLVALTTLFWFPGAENNSWQIQLANGSVVLNSQAYATPQTLTLSANDTLRTTSAARLQTVGGADVRLAANSQVKWRDEHSLYLSAGSAYVDTRELESFVIATDFGEVRDIGTRYMVSVDDERMVVAVREGAAEINSEFGLNTAIALPQTSALLYIDRSGAAQSVEPASNDRWNWIHAVPTGYLDRSVPEVLAQISRDLGKSVRFASRGVQATIASDTVQGNLINLRPRQALELVASSARLSWQESATFITIDFIR